ncbi:TIGR03982 family His-Xaa-Ser system protein [Pseudomonadota bacterium]|nr:TIGR03982 family His-Xaa-Ser system protein [Pseudomonadota bacterium]
MKFKSIIYINIFCSIIIIFLGLKIFLAPLLGKIIWGEEYKKLAFGCDNVMREHLITKNELKSKVNKKNVQNLRSAELGLISCHDYDILRKKLLIWGVSNRELSLLSLEAIEENTNDVRDFIKTHEFSY